MQKTIVNRVIALMLVALMCCSFFPTAFAAEITATEVPEEDSSVSTQPTESEITQESMAPTEPAASIPQESTVPTTAPETDDSTTPETSPAETEPETTSSDSTPTEEKTALELYVERLDFLNNQASALDVEFYLQPSEEAYNQMMAMHPMAAGDQEYTQKHIYVVGCIETYKSFTMPNGSERRSFGQYALDINGDGVFSRTEMAYCIEPYVDVLGGNIYNSTETSAGSKVSSPWGNLTWEQQQAIGLTLLYGYPNMITDGETIRQRLCDQLATSIIIHEIVLGWRNTYPPYNCTNSVYIDTIANPDNSGHYAYGVFVENAGIAGKWIDYQRLRDTYNRISNGLAKHVIPSFTKGRPQTAPVHTMQPTSNGKYTVTLTDTVGTLADFTFPKIPGLTFSKKGNSLTITADSYDAIPSSVIKATGKNFPSAEKSAYLIWDGNKNGKQSQDQICIKPGCARSDPIPAYFMLKAAPVGKLEISKTTEDGKNLGGWKFRITGNGIDTTVTSDKNGSLPVQKLKAGTYTVTEIGNTDPEIDKRYVCATQNPQKVNVKAGSLTSVSFYNKLNTGSLQIKKAVNAGTLAGWKFGIYTDAACKNPIQGSPFTTPASGVITVTGLYPGTYYVREIDESGLYPNWKFDTSRKDIVVEAGKTAETTVMNTLLGRIIVRKNAVNGSPEAWTFEIYDQSGTVVDTITTGPDGLATSKYLIPGKYVIREIHDRSTEYWTYDSEVEKGVTVTAGKDQTVTYTNIQSGLIQVKKIMETDGPVEGWKFKITDSSGTEIPGSPFATDANGLILTGKLAPGQYTIEELIPENSLYFCTSENPQTITAVAGETAAVSFTNALRPGKIGILKIDPTGTPLAGAKFLLEWSEDGKVWSPVMYSEKPGPVLGGCSNADLVDGSLISGENGQVEWTGLHPGIFYRITETEAPNGYVLLSGTAWEGKLPTEDFTVQLRVTNAPILTLPKTGSSEMLRIPIAFALFLLHGAGAIWIMKKKED